MLETATITQTGLRLEYVSLEMQSLNARSTGDRILSDILDYCVPRRYLQAFTLWGFQGEEAHARFEVTVDYDEHDRQVTISGDGLPAGIAGKYGFDVCLRRDDGPQPASPDSCPHMGKALDLYIKLLKDRNLRLVWSVRFREKSDEMCAKFGLVTVVIRDCTLSGAANAVTNSRYPELTATARVSETIAPGR